MRDETAEQPAPLRSGLTTRHFGEAIRLEVVSSCPEPLWRFLLQQFAGQTCQRGVVFQQQNAIHQQRA